MILSNLLPLPFQLEAAGSRGEGWQMGHKAQHRGADGGGNKKNQRRETQSGRGEIPGGPGRRGEMKEGGECEPALPAVFRHLTAVRNNTSVCLREEAVNGRSGGGNPYLLSGIVVFFFLKKNLS